jgi:hypothetical protein
MARIAVELATIRREAKRRRRVGLLIGGTLHWRLRPADQTTGVTGERSGPTESGTPIGYGAPMKTM